MFPCPGCTKWLPSSNAGCSEPTRDRSPRSIWVPISMNSPSASIVVTLAGADCSSCAYSSTRSLRHPLAIGLRALAPKHKTTSCSGHCTQAATPLQKYALIRTIQRERRYLNIKTLTALTLHLVGSAHHPRRRVERRATRVFKALSWLEDRLLPDDTWSFDLGQFATRIRDHPVPAQQMHRFPSLILDDHSISPKILRAVRRRSHLKVSRLNAHRYSPCVCRVRCPICHR